MSGLYSQYKTNTGKETSGIEIEMSEATNEDDTVPTFLIARMSKSNKDYSKALEAATRPYRRQIDLGVMKNDTADAVLLDVFVNTILRGWRNVYDSAGNAIVFSKTAAKALLSELPDLYDRLQEEAKIASNFRDLMLEDEAKN